MEKQSLTAQRMLADINHTQTVVAAYSENNGIILLVWGMAFLLDMVGFDVSLSLKSVFPGLIFMCCLNLVVLIWRFWYAQHLPIRPLRSLNNRVIFFWSLYYVPLVGLGVGGWLMVFDTYPPFWLSLIGILGALPLLLTGGYVLRRTYIAGMKNNGKISA